MKRTSTVILWLCTATLCITVVGLFGTRAVAAQRRHNTTKVRIEQAAEHMHAIELLRADSFSASFLRVQHGHEGQREQLAPRVMRSLEASGLSEENMVRLSPESTQTQRTHSGTHIETSRATLSLHQLTLPQLGQWIDAWGTWDTPTTPWTITSCTIAPQQSTGDAERGGRGGDMDISASIMLESLRIQPQELPQELP